MAALGERAVAGQMRVGMRLCDVPKLAPGHERAVERNLHAGGLRAYPWLPTTMPATISTRPTIFSGVTGSWKNTALPSTTIAKVSAVIGKAWLSCSFVIASI